MKMPSSHFRASNQRCLRVSSMFLLSTVVLSSALASLANECKASAGVDCSIHSEPDAASLLQGHVSTMMGVPSAVEAIDKMQHSIMSSTVLLSTSSESSLRASEKRSRVMYGIVALADTGQDSNPVHASRLLPVIALMCAAVGMIKFGLEKKHAMLTLIAIWFTSSMTMSIMNKIAVVAIPLPMTLLVVQMLIAIVLLFAIFGPLQMWQEIRENSDYAKRWSLMCLFFSSGLITSLLALQAGSVILMLVVRNVMPLFTLVVERRLLPIESTQAVTWEAIFALTILALGTTLYAVLDLLDAGTWNALGYIILNMVAMLVYRLVERKLLIGMPQSLSFGSLNLMQNIFGMLPVIVLFFLWGEHRTVRGSILLACRDPMAMTCVLSSGCTGLALGYFSTKLQKEITATSFLALQSSTKVMTILLAVLVLGEMPGLLALCGCTVSLAGGAWYGYIASRPQPQPDEGEAVAPKTTK